MVTDGDRRALDEQRRARGAQLARQGLSYRQATDILREEFGSGIRKQDFYRARPPEQRPPRREPLPPPPPVKESPGVEKKLTQIQQTALAGRNDAADLYRYMAEERYRSGSGKMPTVREVTEELENRGNRVSAKAVREGVRRSKQQQAAGVPLSRLGGQGNPSPNRKPQPTRQAPLIDEPYRYQVMVQMTNPNDGSSYYERLRFGSSTRLDLREIRRRGRERARSFASRPNRQRRTMPYQWSDRNEVIFDELTVGTNWRVG